MTQTEQLLIELDHANEMINNLNQQLKEAREVIECLSKEYAKVIEEEFSDSHEVLMVIPEEHMAYKKAQLWLKKYGEGNENNTM